MNNNAAWFVTLIIILPTLCSKGEQAIIATNGKNDGKFFLDDVTSKNRSSNDAESTLDLSTGRFILMAVQSSLKTKVPWKNKYLNRTAPQIIEAVELREVGSGRSIYLPTLSVKDTLLTVSSKKPPTTEDLLLSFSKDNTERNYTSGGKFMHMPRKLESREKHSWVHQKQDHYILWNSPKESESLIKRKLFFQSYYKRSFLNRLASITNDKFHNINDTESVINDSTVPSTQIPKRHIHAFQDGVARHVLKRETLVPTEDQNLDFSSNKIQIKSITLKDSTEENVTAISEIYQTTRGSQPATIKPEEEEFLPGMTKSVFITITSSSLITLFLAVVSLYYIRRRRVRMAMDPERQRLITFRAYTGIYYNQTGPCF